jgi:hypothetical protein
MMAAMPINANQSACTTTSFTEKGCSCSFHLVLNITPFFFLSSARPLSKLPFRGICGYDNEDVSTHITLPVLIINQLIR